MDMLVDEQLNKAAIPEAEKYIITYDATRYIIYKCCFIYNVIQYIIL